MVRSLSIVGAVLSIFASQTSAFAPQNSQFAFSSSHSLQDSHASRPTTTALSASATFIRDDVVMMPATLDRPTVNPGTAGPAVLDRPVVEKNKSKEQIKERQTTGSEGWEVRIYNDGKNTREFVARCLVQIVAQSEIEAYQTMMQAHQNGIAVVGTYVYEVAEMYYGALKKNGIVCDIVPVEEDR